MAVPPGRAGYEPGVRDCASFRRVSAVFSPNQQNPSFSLLQIIQLWTKLWTAFTDMPQLVSYSSDVPVVVMRTSRGSYCFGGISARNSRVERKSLRPHSTDRSFICTYDFFVEGKTIWHVILNTVNAAKPLLPHFYSGNCFYLSSVWVGQGSSYAGGTLTLAIQVFTMGDGTRCPDRVSVPCISCHTRCKCSMWQPLIIRWRSSSVSMSWNWWKVRLVEKSLLVKDQNVC